MWTLSWMQCVNEGDGGMANDRLGAGVQRRAPVIGITGNIGAGKSTVARILGERGVRVIDADRVVHDLYAAPDSALAAAVIAEFGSGIVAQDGSLDRAALGKIVFHEAAALSRLEKIVHPAVVAAVREALDGAAPQTPCAVEAIKLIESDLLTMLAAVWIVVAPAEAQLARLSAKGMQRAEAQRRLDAQATPEAKLALLRRKRGASAPVVTIENTGTLAQLRRGVRDAWQSTQDAWSKAEER